MLTMMTNNVICFKKAEKKIEDDCLAAVDEYLRQQDWFLEAEARLKRKRDYILLLFIFDLFLRVVAFLI